ncbi:DsrE/DsrF/TusD sulfur relay family protein [Thiomicrorhabdus sediminis]|uniref:Sulfur reduction protein DsrE n=1 Tax=Thiomicrorhabdus sediminis TaxID=2580412 RepID=A0A4P9K982_9GAMM|nr:DsrE family protein [Thiomicrorhabdus sediminis]QCU90996.1 sulfur reduction protein DsrE [Thiomicrorhabdus sediminis]
MKVLLIFNKEPYDGTDVTWNGLRLANQLHEDNHEVRIFIMNDAVDLVRDINVDNQTYDQDLVSILNNLIEKGVEIKACGTCMSRCGIYKNKPYILGVDKSTMKDLSNWVTSSDRVINL